MLTFKPGAFLRTPGATHTPSKPSYGRIFGFAAPFEKCSSPRREDNLIVRTRFLRGAFERSLASISAKRLTVPLVWRHDHDDVICSTLNALTIWEGVLGLCLTVSEEWRAGRGLRDLLQHREPMALSLRVDLHASKFSTRRDADGTTICTYSEAALHHIGITEFPGFEDTFIRRHERPGIE